LALPTADPSELTPELTFDPSELAPDSIVLPTDSTESVTDCTTPLDVFLRLRLADVLRADDALRPVDLALVDLADERERDVPERLAAGRERVVDARPLAARPFADLRALLDCLVRVALGALPFELRVGLVRFALPDDFRPCDVLV
jgi:hypothetical protein